jgi:hypothetical protein
MWLCMSAAGSNLCCYDLCADTCLCVLVDSVRLNVTFGTRKVVNYALEG